MRVWWLEKLPARGDWLPVLQPCGGAATGSRCSPYPEKLLPPER